MKKMVIFFLVLLTACSVIYKRPVCKQMKIVKVGACDREGWCSVILKDGTIAFARYPVAGYNTEVCHCDNKPATPGQSNTYSCL